MGPFSKSEVDALLALFAVWRAEVDRVPFAYESFWAALPAVDARMAEAAKR